jgi:hypothetical protein
MQNLSELWVLLAPSPSLHAATHRVRFQSQVTGPLDTVQQEVAVRRLQAAARGWAGRRHAQAARELGHEVR